MKQSGCVRQWAVDLTDRVYGNNGPMCVFGDCATGASGNWQLATTTNISITYHARHQLGASSIPIPSFRAPICGMISKRSWCQQVHQGQGAGQLSCGSRSSSCQLDSISVLPGGRLGTLSGNGSSRCLSERMTLAWCLLAAEACGRLVRLPKFCSIVLQPCHAACHETSVSGWASRWGGACSVTPARPPTECV